MGQLSLRSTLGVPSLAVGRARGLGSPDGPASPPKPTGPADARLMGGHPRDQIRTRGDRNRRRPLATALAIGTLLAGALMGLGAHKAQAAVQTIDGSENGYYVVFSIDSSNWGVLDGHHPRPLRQAPQ